MISGIAISRDNWLEAQRARRGADDGLNDMWQQYSHAKRQEEDPDQSDWFLHLRDATHVGGHGFMPSNGGVLMRVRVSEVTSWALTFVGKSDLAVPEDDDNDA